MYLSSPEVGHGVVGAHGNLRNEDIQQMVGIYGRLSRLSHGTVDMANLKKILRLECVLYSTDTANLEHRNGDLSNKVI